MKITKNFDLYEFVKNSHGFDVPVSEYDLQNIKRICTEILQPLRNEFGVPINITSGKRSHGLNAVVGGKEGSLHLYAQAVDFQVAEPFMLLKMYTHIVCNLPYHKVIYYNHDVIKKRFIHVSLKKSDNKHEAFIEEYGRFFRLDFWLKHQLITGNRGYIQKDLAKNLHLA